MRTASRGGRWPALRYRRTLLYEARATSIENVESGLCTTSGGATPMTPPATPPTTPPTTPPAIDSLRISAGIGGGGAAVDDRASRSTTLGGGGPFTSSLHETNSSVAKSRADRMTMSVSVGDETGTSFGLRRVRMGGSFRRC